MSSKADAAPGPSGAMTPAAMPFWTGRTAFRNAARTVAAIYDMKADPASTA
jgi:hypothetical protein